MIKRWHLPPFMRNVGLWLVYAGALSLILSYAFGVTNLNPLLLFSLFLIVAGIILHVMILKRESRY